jgi:DNA modification methylase
MRRIGGRIVENWAKIIIGDSRAMVELEDQSIDLAVTSPPYWHIKDYGVPGQIGYSQTLHDYLRDLYRVWRECHRVLKPGRRLCINVGDQFARSAVYGRYKVIPLHAEIIVQCEDIGFDYMGSIIWQKRTTMNTTGGANVMGSYPYPPNGMVEIDYEFIMIFKKPGKSRSVPREIKERSRLEKREWKELFHGHWAFGGARQVGHEAMFPNELPKRLIRMYSYIDETVLDPFLGSGTTAKAAWELGRNSVGYETNELFVDKIEEKLGISGQGRLAFSTPDIQIARQSAVSCAQDLDYVPCIPDASPVVDPKSFEADRSRFQRVEEVIDECALRLDSGLVVVFLGVTVRKPEETGRYLKERVLGKEVRIGFDGEQPSGEGPVGAYVYLKNGIFVNSYLIKSGLASADASKDHKHRQRFLRLEGTGRPRSVWTEGQTGQPDERRVK